MLKRNKIYLSRLSYSFSVSLDGAKGDVTSRRNFSWVNPNGIKKLENKKRTNARVLGPSAGGNLC